MAKKIIRNNEEWIQLSADEVIEAMKGESVELEDGKLHNFSIWDDRDVKGRLSSQTVIINKILVDEEIIIDKNHLNYGQIFFNSILIEGGEFKKNIVINDGHFDGQFTISGGVFHNRFVVAGGFFLGWFHIEGGLFDSFWIDGGEFSQGFCVNGGEYKYGFRTDGGQFNEYRIEGGELKSISIAGENIYIDKLICVLQNFAKFGINKCHINCLSFESVINRDYSIHLRNLKVNQIIFHKNFENHGILSISKLKGTNIPHSSIEKKENKHSTKPSELIFLNADMGNTTFIDTNFDSFDKIVLRRSRLSSISTNHGHFPLKTKYPDKIYSDQSGQEDYTELAETYNQLQLAMQKQGNRTWAFKYYAEYMERYRLEQKEKKNWAQYITLSLNKLSTNYGASWIRSFILILLVGLLFFIAYVLTLPKLKVGFEFLTWQNVTENLAYFSRYYFDFIIPTHKIDFIGEYKAGFWSAFIDVLGRIIIGYLIYQTIAAFRQFGKR